MWASREKAFTLVELIVVIVVLAVIASITIVSYSTTKRQAKASAVTATLSSIDRAFGAWAKTNNLSRWPPDSMPGGGGTALQDRIDDKSALPWSNFSDFLPSVPADSGFGTQQWYYDQDEDVVPDGTAHYNYCLTNRTDPTCTADDKTACSTTEGQKLTGVNIVIQWLTANDEKTAQNVNDAIDGNAESDWKGCGKVRWYFDSANNRYAILYALSYTKAI